MLPLLLFPHLCQEYEERLARLRADYEAEQESRARLEEDITAMRNSYDVKLSTLEENLLKETEAVLKAEVLYKAKVMSRAEFASSSEYSPTFQYKMAVKPEIYSMPDTLPSEGVFKTEVSSRFEELPTVEACKSEASLGSDESSTLEESFISTAFPGLREPSSLEVPVPEVVAPSGHFLDEDVGREATEPLWEEEPFLRGEEPHLRALELPGLHNPLAVEAKLARLSSTGARLDVPQADVPKVTTQVADVMQDAMGAELSWGTEVMGHVQTSNLCCSGTAGTTSAVSLAWRQLSCSGVWEREALSNAL
ncbi:kinesin-like protein KIF17 [Pontoporia blainvillei]|uniref:Kinesin-like protein KIF17 n=1 Tax=Pontoporia blainvillei TaxID=48723 RepID=A0ABX0S0V6_PONBL|nr:kinesin-like protein KIF17 [Pontoporia blainvillei]